MKKIQSLHSVFRKQRPFRWCFFFFLTPYYLHAQFSYINPLPGSQYKNPQTSITIRCTVPIRSSSLNKKNWIEISGSRSGRHQCTAHLAQDGKNIIIISQPVFDYDERVTVVIHSALEKLKGGLLEGITFSFQTRKAISPQMLVAYDNARNKIWLEDFSYASTQTNSKGEFDSVPTFKILVNDHPAEGSVFFNNSFGFENYTNRHLAIITNSGHWVWARDLGISGSDFKINLNGYLTYFNHVTLKWEMLDSSYHLIDSFQCRNGFENETDPHEFQILPDGHKFMFAYDAQTIDMSQIVAGGQVDATVIGLIIQEQDVAGDVVFEWSSWDHFNIPDADPDINLTNGYIDPVHGNALEVDHDGNLLLSSRHLNEISKIDHSTGDFIWRFGGKNNQFTFVNDSVPLGFSHQHDVRRLANGDITLFNNGNYLSPEVSTAKEYSLDEVNKVATLVWSYQHPPVNGYLLSYPVAGSVQRLSNGNTFINWGLNNEGKGFPNMTEVTPDGKIVWEMKFDSSIMYSYRGHKYTWDTLLTGTEVIHQSTPVVLVYPNPCSSSARFYFTLAHADKITFHLYDSEGKLIQAETMQYAPGISQLDLTVEGRQAGIYYFMMNTSTWSYAGKIIVIK